jgi:hypothetical protein
MTLRAPEAGLLRREASAGCDGHRRTLDPLADGRLGLTGVIGGGLAVVSGLMFGRAANAIRPSAANHSSCYRVSSAAAATALGML